MEHFHLSPADIDRLEMWQFDQCIERLEEIRPR